MKSSIGIKVAGGLGNQLFQYFTAYCLSRKLNACLLVYIDDEQLRSEDRHFWLEQLGFPFKRLSSTDLYWRAALGGRRRTITKLLPWLRLEPFWAESPGFVPALSELQPGVLLQGNFQSYRHFIGYEHEIRQMLEAGCPKISNLSHTVDFASVCAVHWRLGDYVTNANANTKFGCVSSEYYSHAVSTIESLREISNYLIFSDDYEKLPKDVSKLFQGKCIFAKDVLRNATDLEEFSLMRHCQHVILPNSTYSWWAAFSRLQAGLTIAPKPWALIGNSLFSDLLPPMWLQLDAPREPKVGKWNWT